MSAGGIIAVTGGVHAGASVLMSEGHELTIGSGGATACCSSTTVSSHNT
ncbi:hypothetical protein [Paraburkholderia azotifigens]|nr:hypothetical protein [Paraburkholderia azotifigens]